MRVTEAEPESVVVNVTTSTSCVTSVSPSSSSVASPTNKRCRDPEDDLYVDNLNSHKRYLTEVIKLYIFPSLGRILLHNCRLHAKRCLMKPIEAVDAQSSAFELH
ncbi:hypothetical protein Tco_0071896 [Tanacetum coccineum]